MTVKELHTDNAIKVALAEVISNTLKSATFFATLFTKDTDEATVNISSDLLTMLGLASDAGIPLGKEADVLFNSALSSKIARTYIGSITVNLAKEIQAALDEYISVNRENKEMNEDKKKSIYKDIAETILDDVMLNLSGLTKEQVDKLNSMKDVIMVRLSSWKEETEKLEKHIKSIYCVVDTGTDKIIIGKNNKIILTDIDISKLEDKGIVFQKGYVIGDGLDIIVSKHGNEVTLIAENIGLVMHGTPGHIADAITAIIIDRDPASIIIDRRSARLKINTRNNDRYPFMENKAIMMVTGEKYVSPFYIVDKELAEILKP